uniref:type I restriction-modification system subunit M n=1 Tax=Mycoplasmopsis cricetuli TaxID=171283 RepID=UPI00047125C5
MKKENINAIHLNDIEDKLWNACDEMRGNISSEQYMHIVIGIIFLKTLSDKIARAQEKFKEEYPEKADQWNKIESKLGLLNKYDIKFLVPEQAKWDNLVKYIGTEEIGEKIDNAFLALEEQNDNLKGLFDKNFNRPDLDKTRLGNVIKEFTNINFAKTKEDFIGRLYEYFLGKFFRKQGQNGGEFYTPKTIVELMVELLNPSENSKIYDPACGTGGMFVQSRKFLTKNEKKLDGIKIYGQEFSSQTWKLAKINLIINGFDPDDVYLGHKPEDTFKEDLSKNEQFDIILANPPFNMKKWITNDISKDPRFKWGLPPEGNANYAWLSHIVYKLNENGRAAVILANGSISTSQKQELEIRKKLIEQNKVEAIIALPDKLFYTTGIPATIWIFNNNKSNDDILLVDAGNLGEMETKKLRILTKTDIQKITNVYKQYQKNENPIVKGFAKVISVDEIKENDYSLVPGRYVEIEEEKIDKEMLKKEIKELQSDIKILFKEFIDLMPEVEKAIEKAIDF